MATGKHDIIEMGPMGYVPDPRGAGFVFFESMIRNSSKIAQIDVITGTTDTFGDLLQRCVRTAIKMRSLGITTKDIISICSSNHLNSCVPFVASFFIGATVSSLDPNLSYNDVKHLMRQLQPKLLFAAKESVQQLTDIIDELNLETRIVVFGNEVNCMPFSYFLEEPNQEEENNFKPVQIQDLSKDAVILLSSGTTGLPKGICISHRSVLVQAAVTTTLEACYDRILNFASLYWGSTVAYCIVSLISGYARIIAPKFDINSVWNIIHVFKPTFMFVPPFYAITMCKSGIPQGINTDSLKSITVCGGPLLTNQMIDFKKLFSKQRVFLSYALSETFFNAYFTCGNKSDDEFIDKKPGSSGSGLNGFSYKIVDPDTEKILGPNEKGELRIKSNFMLTGYFKMDSSNVWDDEGYLKTGDIAYYDEDRYFFIIDRLKEMMKYQSFHVLPSNIESVLLIHPSVKVAVVIGIPHSVDGDHPMAFVVLNEQCSDITEEELIKYVHDRVNDREKLRAGLKIVDSLPFTPSGKVNRREVKNRVLNNISTQST